MSTTVDNADQSNVTGGSELGKQVVLGETVVAGTGSNVQKEGGKTAFTDLEAFFRREVKIYNFTLAGTDITGALSTQMPLLCPYARLRSNAAIYARMKGYKYFKADCVVRFSVDAPSNAYGAYLFTALPMGTHDLDRPTANFLTQTNSFQGTQCDYHGVMNIGLGNAVEFRLPFFHNKEWAKTNPGTLDTDTWGYAMWALNCHCWCPLRNATGSDALSLTVNVWAHFENIQFMSPQLEGKRAYPSKDDKWLSKSLVDAAGAAGGMSEVPVIGAYATPAAAGLSVAATLADMMGFTRAQKTEDPRPMMSRLFSSLTTVAGNDTSENVALYPGTSSSIDPSLVAPVQEDQLSLDYLLQKWTVVAQVTWSASAAVGSNLVNIPVTPGQCLASGTNTYYPSPAGFIGTPFTYWRGGMEYMVYIPVSSFHKGRLQICWADKKHTSHATDPTNQLYNVLMDVTSSNRLCFKVGWQSDLPALRMRISNAAAGDLFINGNVGVYVASPLLAPDPNTSTIVTILARACPDMRFTLPKAVEESDLYGSSDSVLTTWTLEGGVVGESSEEIDCIELVPSVGTLFGSMGGNIETFESIRPLLQKFTHYWRGKLSQAPHFFVFPLRAAPPLSGYPLSTWSGTNFLIPPAPFWTQNNGQTPGYGTNCWKPYFTWYGWYTAMYAGITGGARMKIHAAPISQADVAAAERPITVIANNINAQVVFAASDNQPSSGDASSVGAAHNAWQVIKDTNGAEFNFPSYCVQRLFEPRGAPQNVGGANFDPDSSEGSHGRVHERVMFGFPYAHTLPTGSDYVLNFFYAGSSDASCTMFKMCPRMIYRVRNEKPPQFEALELSY